MAEQKETKVEEAPQSESAAPAAAPQAAAPVTPPKKSHTALIVVIVLLVIFIGLPAIGFGAFWFFVGSKINGFVDKAQKGQVEVNLGGNKVSVNGSGNATWPSSMPGVVPKFSAGKITNSAQIADTWTITATGVTEADYNSYIAKLTSSGFTMDEPLDANGVKSGGGVKAGYRVSVTYSPDEQGQKTILIVVSKETANSGN